MPHKNINDLMMLRALLNQEFNVSERKCSYIKCIALMSGRESKEGR